MFLAIILGHLFVISIHKTLVLATHNSHKQLEMKMILSDLNIQVIGLDQFPHIGEIEETGTTLIENSLLKAKTVYDITGLPCLADDTGLEVKSLNGAPGVYSARYAGKNATFSDNMNKVLNELNKLDDLERFAIFRTVLSLVDEKTEITREGSVEGKITFSSIGDHGFGYDSIFQPKGFEMTYAQMVDKQKNKISHRAIALNEMKDVLIKHFKKGGIIE
tara:strand:- start:789 stop:1445 length:657 start_codon:yes stop_codon:yes gene_type:complete